MLPISIVEKAGFREYIEHLDPSFNMPTRFKIKESGLPDLKRIVEEKINVELARIQSINMSLDGWSDAVKRSFSGYISQGKQMCFLIMHN